MALCSGEAKKRTNLIVAGKQKMPRQTTIVPSTFITWNINQSKGKRRQKGPFVKMIDV